MFEAKENKNNFRMQDSKSEGYCRQEMEVMIQNIGIQCGICNEYFKDQEEVTSLCGCEHLFCKTCLKYYAIHKLKNQFSDIQCPRQGCNSFINKKGITFQSLPVDLQLRYDKIKENLNAIKFRSQKLCPDCSQQMAMLNNQSNLFCQKCLKKYCPLCLNKAHPKFARCEAQVIKLLKRQFKYKQCKKCLFIVERIDGCNHMVCSCGYQFCYGCGGFWDNGYHECPPIQPWRRPISYKVVKRVIPERQPFALASINMMFNPQQIEPKGRKVNLNKNQYQIKGPKVQNKVSVRQKTTNNSIIINNRSMMN